MKSLAITYGLYPFLTGIALFQLSLTWAHQGDRHVSEIRGYRSILLPL
ncbi:MAG: hypothetical protein O2965_01645 [Bacteroidetes bacterium]|nr:hypothetical protein [Bacteroidota bacterium]